MILNNDSSSIIIKFNAEKVDLPKRHLITTILIDGIHYGFYLNKIDIEKSQCALYIGKYLKFPDSYRAQFNLLQNIYKCPALKAKPLVNFANSSNTRNSMIKNYFKTNDDIFKVCCTFHADRHPSMVVNLKLGVFHCFSCKSGGPVTKLLNKIRNGSV